MDRRKSIKVLALGTFSAGVFLEACKVGDKKTANKPVATTPADGAVMPAGIMKEEAEHLARVQSETYFTEHEMATITVLADIIIPADDVSGSASEAGVPDFIEFIVKDMPQHKLPMRGGLQWLDQQCLKRFDNVFVNCSSKQQIELVDMIAYPNRAKKEMKPGVKFFNLMRNLTASGFYTTPMGVKDVGYVGNQPNMWNGVPDDVLKQYGLSYTEQEMKECASYPESKS
ncbi:MAG: gluconate 2-dehydrogenase subunit 3 family protein [Chitinophagaceae bacterium]|nr:gluconate 2-dehydrogenase subunit 3 family protein [Chitinophagaceae bacterium]